MAWCSTYGQICHCGLQNTCNSFKILKKNLTRVVLILVVIMGPNWHKWAKIEVKLNTVLNKKDGL